MEQNQERPTLLGCPFLSFASSVHQHALLSQARAKQHGPVPFQRAQEEEGGEVIVRACVANHAKGPTPRLHSVTAQQA